MLWRVGDSTVDSAVDSNAGFTVDSILDSTIDSAVDSTVLRCPSEPMPSAPQYRAGALGKLRYCGLCLGSTVSSNADSIIDSAVEFYCASAPH